MAKRSKRYSEVVNKVDKTRSYSPEEAFKLVKETASVKFNETVELSVKLGVNPKHADQNIRGTVVLPNGTGKEVRVIVFARGEKIKEAEEAGADLVGAEELVEKIEGGWLDFDVCIAAPDMMKHVGKIAKILGPRKLMPNPKSGTVTFELKKTIGDSKKGRLEFRTDRNGVIHSTFGRMSFGLKELMENYLALVDAIIRSKPSTAKGRYIKSVYISSTMGPSIKLDPNKVTEAMEAA